MESPVRICLGAALVVYLLLLSSTPAAGNASNETTSSTVRDERSSKYAKVNGTTWVSRGKPKTPDVALNELNPKESVSEEHTDKNAKYKDRGRVRFGAQSQRTAALRSRVRGQASTSSTTEGSAPKLMIVTPEPEKKNVSQIMDSMRVYKKTKLPVIASTTPITIVKKEVTSHSEEYDNEYEEKESIEKYTTKGLSHTYHIPGFTDDDDDDFSQDSVKDATENRVHKDFSIPSYEKFSTYFPKEISYSPQHEKTYKSESYFHNFDSDLTTPKNDIFDKRFKEISSSIIKNLDTIKTKSPRTNKTNVHKIIKENVDVSKFNQGTPTNKSTVIIKNTKEVRLSDNEGAGSANQELSDVHGTSIYYEMTVHSTETYAIDQSDDDCDNETATIAPTPSTTNEEELSALPGTSRLVLTTLPTDSTKSSSKSSPTTTTTVSTSHNSILSTEETMTTKVFSSSYNRNRSYKRYNLNGTKDMNKITPNDQVGSNQVYRPVTRSPAKFHFTTPKTKPIWMAPRRNVTRGYTKTTYPTTIYSEHFNIKDKLSTTTTQPRQPNKSLTTQSSDIDPVLQSEVTGVKKVVHSQTITDNSIPSLWKRGSAKFATMTEVTTDTGDTSDLEIPPTLTAWALASLRSPPSTAVTNGTASDLKNVDENELQKVGELIENKEVTTTTTAAATTAADTTAAATTAAATTAAAATTVASLNNDVTIKIITDVPPKRTSWKALGEANIPETTTLMQTETTTSQTESETTDNDIKTTTSSDEYEDLEATVHTSTTESSADETTTESKSESQPAESNISLQSSAEPHTTENILTRRPYTDVSAADLIGLTKPSIYPPPWWTEANTSNFQEITYGDSKRNGTTPMQKISTTKSAGFESITKLPSGITTPQGDEMGLATRSHEIYPGINTALPTTTDYEITTYRSRYVPQMTTDQPIGTIDGGRITPYDWRPMLPTKTTIVQGPTKVTDIFADAPITTYRPSASSENIQETSTSIPEITSKEVALSTDTETSPPQTSETETSINQESTTFVETLTDTVQPTTDISTETEPPSKPTTNIPETEPSDSITASEENSGSNEVITQISTKLTTQPSATTKELEELTSLSEPADGTTSLSPEVVKDPTTITEDVDMATTTAKLPTTLITGGKVYEDATEKDESIIESTTEPMLTTLSSELESSSGILSPEEAGSGAAIAITVSTIGVIALILLVGLLLVVRRRGRRGVYAQRCTPVSLDAYSLDSVSVGHRKGGNHLRASKRSYGNPAFDDEVTSHPMQYAALANFALDTEQMTTEFSEIPSVTVRPDEVPPGCEDKNRYSNVLPLPETRVPLQRIGNDPTTEYINANYVTGPGNIKNYYIACQAPLHNTVADLWRMIWEQNSRLIVMLTEYMENGVEKCYEYLPPSEISDNRRTFGDFQVILKKREQHDKYAISTVQLINLRTRTWREITHMWYFWPAKGVPDDYDSIIDFLTEMRGYMKMAQAAKEFDEDGVEVIYGESRSSFHNLSKLRSDENASNGNGVHVYSPAKAEELLRRNTATNGTLSRMKVASEIEGVRPCVVMCASGAGRAAAVIALDVCARALSGGAVDVPRVVRELRAQRPHSLANRHHYIFVYKVLSEYGNKLMGGGVDTI